MKHMTRSNPLNLIRFASFHISHQDENHPPAHSRKNNHIVHISRNSAEHSEQDTSSTRNTTVTNPFTENTTNCIATTTTTTATTTAVTTDTDVDLVKVQHYMKAAATECRIKKGGKHRTSF